MIQLKFTLYKIHTVPNCDRDWIFQGFLSIFEGFDGKEVVCYEAINTVIEKQLVSKC